MNRRQFLGKAFAFGVGLAAGTAAAKAAEPAPLMEVVPITVKLSHEDEARIREMVEEYCNSFKRWHVLNSATC